jgi:hypothetical protein
MKKSALLIGIPLFLTFHVHAATAQIHETPRDTTVTFVFSQFLGVGESFSIPLGDIDGDDDLDAVVMNYEEFNRVWINDGTGVYSAAQELGSTTGHGGELGDLDGDDDLDLFLVHNLTTDQVFLNDGSGVFTATSQTLGNADDYGVYVNLGDIDGDDDLDALVQNYMHRNRVWLNDGTGHFTDSGQSLGGENSGPMALGDLDSDDDLDVIVQYYDDYDKIWFNDGTGTFFDSGQVLDSLGSWGHVDLGDLDGDQDLDAFITNNEHGNRVWFNNGAGIFAEAGPFFGDSTQKVTLGDLDGDDDLDAVTTHVVSGNFAWLNDGTGNFPWAGVNFGGVDGLSANLGDVDLDEDLDLFLGNGTHYGGHGFVELYLNESVTGVGGGISPLPSPRFSLDQNYPNPFNPVTRIRYELPESMRIVLKIYDLRGRVVKTLVQGHQAAGSKTVVWDGRDNKGRPVGSGVYIYRILALGNHDYENRNGGIRSGNPGIQQLDRKMTLTR